MKPRLWKSARSLVNGLELLELQYRMDDGELCLEYEDDLAALAARYVVPYGRDGIAKVYEANVGGRLVEFVVLPKGAIPLLDCDLEPYVLEGFLNAPGGYRQDRMH